MSSKLKKINKLGMMEIVDGVRTASKDIHNSISNWNPPTGDRGFEVKYEMLEVMGRLEEWLDDFDDNNEWDVRDDADLFD